MKTNKTGWSCKVCGRSFASPKARGPHVRTHAVRTSHRLNGENLGAVSTYIERRIAETEVLLMRYHALLDEVTTKKG